MVCHDWGMRGSGLSLLCGSVAIAAALAGCVGPRPGTPGTTVVRPVPPVARPAPPDARPAPVVPALPPRRPAQPPVEITSDCGISRLRDSVLKQINAARAEARSCGARRMNAAPPLAWSRPLAEAAERHSVDMVARRYFDHASPEGKRVAQRVAAEGYKARVVAENIAGGDTTVAGVISGWLRGPEQCQSIMNPAFTEVGVSCVRQPGSKWGTYWTMVVAARN